MATDFLATYGIDDKALAIGLKRIETLASNHQESMRKKEPFGEAAGRARKELLGMENVAKAAFGGIGTAVGLAVRATDDYAKKNSMVLGEVSALKREMAGLWTDIGRDLSGANRGLVEQIALWRRLRNVVTDYLGAVGSSFINPEGPQSLSQIRDQKTQRVAYESADVLLRARSKMVELEAERLSKGTYATQRLASAELRAKIETERGLREIADLRTELERNGRKKEADLLARSVRLNAEATVQAERQRQSDEDFAGRKSVREKLAAAEKERASARAGAADVLEANAMRLFGLEASERQLQIAEAQLRYDQQLRDLAADKALLEEDRARASALLLEQRDAELGLLRAFRGGVGPGRSIALGSSANPFQVFAKGKDEEKADRKEAQKKFDKMITELRSIRDNTAKAQGATYQ